MIDNQQEVHDLIEALNRHLPIQAYATPPLVMSLRAQGTNLNVDDPLTIDSVLNLGDEGGVACAIGVEGGKTVVMVSITHLRFDGNHPLASQIQAYQSRRSQRLENSENPTSRRSRPSVATKPKRTKARVAPTQTAKMNDLTPRFHAAYEHWMSGDFNRATTSFREVLRADPSDPYFCRYWLASCLFQSKSFDELATLLKQHDDQSGIWRFAQALAAFHFHGDTEEAQRLLVQADRQEPEFEDYLLRDKVVDASLPVRFDAGRAQRAFGCARLFLPAWRMVPGAATWARRVLKVPLPGDANDQPRRFPRDELRALPLRRENWQVGMRPRRPEQDDDPDGEDEALWMFGVANVDGQEVRMVTIVESPFTETIVWNELIQSFLNPNEGEPARPAKLVVCRRDFHDAWTPLLAEIGIRCQYKKDPEPVGELLEMMAAAMEQRELPPAEGLDIREFPQTEAVWQADFIRSPAWISNERDGAYRPWTVLVLDKSGPAALSTSMLRDEPTPEMLLEYLIRTMARPGGESEQRPRLVEVSNSDCYDYVRPRLEAAGVGCNLVDEMREFDDFCLRLADGLDGSEKCALADGEGVTRDQMESFFESAAYYFRQAPWSRVPGEVPIEIRCNDPRMGTRYAIVMGRTGVQLGLCIYDDWKTTIAMLQGYGKMDRSSAMAVCYDEEQIMAAVDLQLIDRLGWPIATPEAWPAVMRLEPRRAPRSPNSEELAFLDACLRAIPDFVNGKSKSQTVNVDVCDRSIELHLLWK